MSGIQPYNPQQPFTPGTPNEVGGHGMFWTALDYLGRPYSAVMGGVVGAMDPNLSVLEGMKEGITGQTHFGAADVLGELGADPKSKWTQLGGLALDIVNPLDPLLYVGAGWTKAGKVIRGLAEGAEGVERATVASRATAAARGLWSPITIAGHAVVPAAAAAPIASVVDKAGEVITRTGLYQGLGRLFGGVNQLESKMPDFAAFLKDGRYQALQKGPQEFAAKVRQVYDHLVSRGLSESEADQVVRKTSALWERPQNMMERLDGELAELDQKVQTAAPAIPSDQARLLTTAEKEQYAKFGEMDQQTLDGEIGQREAALQRDATPGSGTILPPSVRQGMMDDLHVLRSASTNLAAGDLPPREILLGRRHLVEQQRSEVAALWDNAAPETLDAWDYLRPIVTQTQKIYEDALRPLDRNFTFPVENYVKHMFPTGWARAPKAARREAAKAADQAQTWAEELRGKGWGEDAIAYEIKRRLSAKGMVIAPGLTADETRGVFTSFERRQYDLTVDQVNKMAAEGKLPFSFEDNTALIAESAFRDANRWRFGYDAHKFVASKPGWTIDEATFNAMPAAARKDWVRMEYHTPWVAPDKNPFLGKFMRKDVSELMDAHLGTIRHFTSSEGLNGLLQALHAVRKYYSAWTLAPFPSFHVRNLASDMILSHQAGLNPLLDLAKASKNDSSYLASLALVWNRSRIPMVDAEFGRAPDNLKSFIEQVQEKFGGDFNVEKLTDWMSKERVWGEDAMRDLDIGALLSNDPVARQAARRRTLASRAADWLPMQRTERSMMVRAGFTVGARLQDFTKGALFINAVKDALPHATTLDDALTHATAVVRRHLFDYNSLSQFEKQFMKLAFPFYCVPTDAEILTRDGWKTYDQVVVGEKVLALDHERGTLHWTPCLEVAVFDHDEELMEWSLWRRKIRSTLNHRWPVINRSTGKRIFVETKDIRDTHVLPRTGDYLERKSILSPRHAAILGWVVTDGYTRWTNNSCSMMVFQSKGKFLKEVVALLGNEPGWQPNGIGRVMVRQEDVKEIVKCFREKSDLPKIVTKLSRDAAEAMLSAMYLADGNVAEPRKINFIAKSEKTKGGRHVRDAIQILATLTGSWSNLGRQGVTISKSKHLYVHNLKSSRVHYAGKVWCPRTKYGTWVMRQNGIVLFTGNTFTRKNLPVQISTALTDPGKNAWAVRTLNSAWGNAGKEIHPEDLPAWLESDLGAPLVKSKDAQGNPQWEVFTPRGWLPQSDLNEVADLFRHADVQQEMLSRVNPVFKEAFEQALNTDGFTGRQIDSGQTVEIFGVQTPPRAAHLIRNVRLVTELDRLNPGNVFSKVWEATTGATTRPHRREASEGMRWLAAFTSAKTYGVKPAKEEARKVKEGMVAASDNLGKARWAMRQGQPREAQGYLQERQAQIDAAREALGRLNILRRDGAMQVAQKEQR